MAYSPRRPARWAPAGSISPREASRGRPRPAAAGRGPPRAGSPRCTRWAAAPA